MTHDTQPPIGVPILWPLTERLFNLPLLEGIRHGGRGASIDGFLREVFSAGNLRPLIVEIGIGTALILAALGIGHLRARGGPDQAS
jgi:hypothetical protein